ncbi:MAG: hypothetical protein U0X39_03755 [Bacteroidales bacterium]
MDNLEKFIRENREKMDTLTPSPSVWERTRRNISGGNGRRTLYMSAAAAITILVITSAALLLTPGIKRSLISGKTLANPELVETEIYYNNLINSLYNEAKPLLTNKPEVERELMTDMAQLDSICKDIVRDLNDNVSNKEVIEAVIRNYRIKLQILEDMLQHLREEDKNIEKPDDNEI